MESNPIPNLKPNESKSDTFINRSSPLLSQSISVGVREKPYHLGE